MLVHQYLPNIRCLSESLRLLTARSFFQFLHSGCTCVCARASTPTSQSQSLHSPLVYHDPWFPDLPALPCVRSRPLKLRVMDYENNGSHRLLGEMETNSIKLQECARCECTVRAVVAA